MNSGHKMDGWWSDLFSDDAVRNITVLTVLKIIHYDCRIHHACVQNRGVVVLACWGGGGWLGEEINSIKIA